jgi:hypothetical protein
MQVKYNDHDHPVAIKHKDLGDTAWRLYRLGVPYNKQQLKAIVNNPQYNPGSGTWTDIKPFQKLLKDFLDDPDVQASKEDYCRPVYRNNLVDMKGKPMQLGSIFIQNASRKLTTYIVTSVSRTGGARVNRLEDDGNNHWSSYMYGCLLTLPKPEYYLIVEPSFLSDEQKAVLEKVFERYPLCKLGYEEVYGRS